MARRIGIKNHGLGNTKLFFVWRSMRARCKNPKYPAYKWYGQRGIWVCKTWDEDFLSFKKWADGSGYKEGLTLERIDNSKGYSSDNCCWATRKEQVRNRRNTIYIRLNGEEISLGELAERVGLTPGACRQRLYRGWTIEEIVEDAY